MSTGTQMTSGRTALRDEKWATFSCILGWPVQGIWPEYGESEYLNMVDRSNNKTSGGYQILAKTDKGGNVSLLRYPCLGKKSKASIGVGHSSVVTNLKFSLKDEYLYSTGGDDSCVFQWSVVQN